MQNQRKFERNNVNPIQFPIKVEFKIDNKIYFIGKVLDISKTGVLVSVFENETDKIDKNLTEQSEGYIYFIGSGKNTHIHPAKVVRIEKNNFISTIALEFKMTIDGTPLANYTV